MIKPASNLQKGLHLCQVEYVVVIKVMLFDAGLLSTQASEYNCCFGQTRVATNKLTSSGRASR